MENDYDHAAGDWVTSQSRYAAIASRPPFDRLHDLVYDDAAQAWPLLLALLAAVPEDVIHHVGAGPLETFVVRHGADFVDRIEGEAREDARFRRAVLEVNLREGELPPDVERRLVAAFGPRFALLPKTPSQDDCF